MFKPPRPLHRALLGLAIFVISLTAILTPALARSHHPKHHHRFARARVVIPAGATDPVKDAALILDGETGHVLYARNAAAERHPASLTKMMTLYLLFEAMKNGDANLKTVLPISQHAASQRPTNLHLSAGDSISVETAIKAIVVRSANDVAVAIAEALGGTEGHFAALMTAKARALGMHDTFYHNASGLPDELQITTANDLSILARHLAYDFPQYFPYFSTPAFSYRGTTYVTHNNLIGRYDGADGIKTGYTGASGFNLVSSVVRSNMHIIGIVMGGITAHRRDVEMTHLLDDAFAQIARNPSLVARAGVPWKQVAVSLSSLPAGVDFSSQSTSADDEDAAESTSDGQLNNDADTDVIAALPAPQPRTSIVTTSNSEPSITTASHAVAVQNFQSVHAIGRTSDYILARTSITARPAPKPATTIAAAVPKPKARPSNNLTPATRIGLRLDSGEGDIGDLGTPAFKARGPAWTIQIGAFADVNQARSKLAAYAAKSMDVLGRAARIVIPFSGIDGHTLYRARFGPFPEREARQVCARLSQRGQNCFVTLASSR